MSVPIQATQTRRKKPPKLNLHGKTAISALSMLALVGGWNVVGHVEAGADDAAFAAEATTAYVLTPTPSLWPTVPAPAVAPLSTLPPAGNVTVLTELAGSADTSLGAFTVPDVPALAPLPAFEPLPVIPAMPVAPPNSGGGQSSGGSSHRSGGS
jgi:hypothetical protein